MPIYERDDARRALAKELGVKASDIEYMEMRLSERYIGWNEPIKCNNSRSDSDARTIADFVPCKGDQEDSLLAKENKELIRKAMMGLTDREKKVLSRRFFDEVTFREIGEDEGVCRERIRQIERKALHKMKLSLKLLGVEAVEC